MVIKIAIKLNKNERMCIPQLAELTGVPLHDLRIQSACFLATWLCLSHENGAIHSPGVMPAEQNRTENWKCEIHRLGKDSDKVCNNMNKKELVVKYHFTSLFDTLH